MVGARERHHDRFRRRAVLGHEARHLRADLRGNRRAGIDRVHAGQNGLFGKLLEAGANLVGVRPRHQPVFPREGAVERHDILGGAAPNRAHMNRRIGRVEAALRVGPASHLVGHFGQEVDQRRSVLHRVHPKMGGAGMDFPAAHAGLEAVDTLVGVHDRHVRGLAHDHDVRLDAQRGAKLVDHQRRPEAADLFVEREGEMDRCLERAGGELRHEGERDRAEALHVRSAAPIEAAVLLHEAERICVPGLAIHRHHVGMARKRDAGHVARPYRGVQIRLVSRFVVNKCRVNAVRGEIVAHEMNEREVRLTTSRVKEHEPLNHLDGIVMGAGHSHHHSFVGPRLSPRDGSGTRPPITSGSVEE